MAIKFIIEAIKCYFLINFQQYLATELGGHGGGGEYDVQKGFGWTNGVILDLLDRYGATLTASSGSKSHQKI